MENATKALIIAGAILISILIIALGVMIYNNASGTVDSADMTDTEIQAFNSKFTQYMSDNMSSTEVESLIKAVQASNETEYSSGSDRYVQIIVYDNTGFSGSNYTSYGSNTNYVSSNTVKTVISSHYYTYQYDYSSSGLINKIEICWRS